jgi:CubicO group peptidase (beta-lactamase class C family)
LGIESLQAFLLSSGKVNRRFKAGGAKNHPQPANNKQGEKLKTKVSPKGEVKRMHRFVLSILLVLFLGACTSQAPASSPPPQTTTPIPPTSKPIERDYWPTAGWRTSTPEQQGMDSEKLAELMDYLQEQTSIDIHSLLIIRNGYSVLDAYFYPYEPHMLHDLASATKSFMSTLIGIAINQGYIENVEQPVLDFFPGRTVVNLDANKEAMTLEDLLTMRSGLNCLGESTKPQEMMASLDWTQYALDQPMTTEPGAIYDYCGLNPHLLSAIVQETTGKSALALGATHLFGPLGIPDVQWPSDPQGNNWGWGDMKMTPHDMAKLGYLFLNDGQWDGRQIVSAEWVEVATSGGSYGYLWWLKPQGIYFATGVGGQEIWVLPDLDMVVVMTGATWGGGAGAWGDQLMNSRIIPLAESSTPLPAKPDGVALLESSVDQATAAPQSEPVPPLPEIAIQVSGKTIILESNPVGLQSITLDFPGGAEAALRLTFIDGNQIMWPIGLDKVYRFTPFEYGLTMGVKGEWESDNVFVIHRDVIGGYEQERIIATFEEDQITIQIHNLTPGGGGSVTLVGRLED